MKTRLPLLVSSLLAALSVASGVRAARLDEVLSAMGDAGNRLRSLSADFVQTDHDFILGDDEVSTGKLFMQIPGRIRWQYAPPREKVLLVTDDLVKLYNPASNQVQVFEKGKGNEGTDLLIGFGKSNEKIGENYDVSLGEETAKGVVLVLIPKPDSPASLFVEIELTIDKTTWTPARSVFHEPNRDTTDIRFKNVEINGTLPAHIFELDLPKDVEIVRD
jgi:outer membrane lipoprotein carrier protein